MQDYAKASNALTAIWSDILPITGMQETFEDRSLNSRPATKAARDELKMDDVAMSRGAGVREAA